MENKQLDKTLSVMTLAGLVCIFGGILLSRVTPWAGIIVIVGFLLMFVQSVITLCTWKQNKMSENIAAIGFVAGIPVATVLVIISWLSQ